MQRFLPILALCLAGLPGSRAGTLQGIAVDGDGQPVAGVEVHAAFKVSYPLRNPTARQNTGPDGRFILEAPLDGIAYTVYAQKSGWSGPHSTLR